METITFERPKKYPRKTQMNANRNKVNLEMRIHGVLDRATTWYEKTPFTWFCIRVIRVVFGNTRNTGVKFLFGI